MFKIMLFFHLTGLAIWLGSLISLATVTSLLKNQPSSAELRNLLSKIPRLFNRWIHPSSIIVLISGVFMVISMKISESAKPLWLHYMEKGGSLIILLSIIILSIISRKKIIKPLKASIIDMPTVKKGMSTYLTAITTFVLLIISVIFVVSFKF